MVLQEFPRPEPRKHYGALPIVLASPLIAAQGGAGLVSHGEYPLPGELARHAPKSGFAPDELRRVCRKAGEGLGREDAREARFRTAAEMVALWQGLDLPAWEAPYALRDARLGYLKGYERALVSGELSERQTNLAAESRWGEGWQQRLAAARERAR
jgi:hypothetical protein